MDVLSVAVGLIGGALTPLVWVLARAGAAGVTAKVSHLTAWVTLKVTHETPERRRRELAGLVYGCRRGWFLACGRFLVSIHLEPVHEPDRKAADDALRALNPGLRALTPAFLARMGADDTSEEP